MRELLSVIVPCYNEGAVIERTAKAIVDTCTGRAFDFEIIFVNDGSKDDTLAFLKKLAGRSEKIKYISFSRNFGKEAAMLSGLEHCKGSCAVIMDADLQHPPELIVQMYEKYQIPVLMITAKSSFDDMRQGFLSGSDDYMVKPVNVNEMVLRVGALLRRAQILNEHKIVIGSTEFDYDAMTVVTGDETLVLPKKEFLLLYKLAASPGRTFTKQQLMDEVWGYETEADPHTIEVHIGRIRERFKENPDFEIVTMRGLGYKVVKK